MPARLVTNRPRVKREAARLRSFTIAELAEQAGLSTHTVSKLLHLMAEDGEAYADPWQGRKGGQIWYYGSPNNYHTAPAYEVERLLGPLCSRYGAVRKVQPDGKATIQVVSRPDLKLGYDPHSRQHVDMVVRLLESKGLDLS